MRKIAILLVSVTLLSSLLISCNKDKNSGNDAPQYTTPTIQEMDLSAVDISRYVTLGEYSGMTVELASKQGSLHSVLLRRKPARYARGFLRG